MTDSKGASATPSYQTAVAEACALCKQARYLLEDDDGGRQKTHEAFSKLARARELLTPHASKAEVWANDMLAVGGFHCYHERVDCDPGVCCQPCHLKARVAHNVAHRATAHDEHREPRAAGWELAAQKGVLEQRD